MSKSIVRMRSIPTEHLHILSSITVANAVVVHVPNHRVSNGKMAINEEVKCTALAYGYLCCVPFHHAPTKNKKKHERENQSDVLRLFIFDGIECCGIPHRHTVHIYRLMADVVVVDIFKQIQIGEKCFVPKIENKIEIQTKQFPLSFPHITTRLNSYAWVE